MTHKTDAFGRPGYGHDNVDAHARSVEEDALRQIEAAAAENPNNETDMNKRDVAADRAFEDSSVNPAAPEAGEHVVAGEDEDEDVSHVATDDRGESVFFGRGNVETGDESRSEHEER